MLDELALVAAALDGDIEALRRLAQIDQDGIIGRRHRASAALGLRAKQLDVDGPAVTGWRRQLLAASARVMTLEDLAQRLDRALTGPAVEWLPIKGYDLAARVYRQAEERTCGDLDLLIAADDLDAARRALDSAGFEALVDGPRAERYLHEEGYAWQAIDEHRELVEVHFRLWGSVPESMAKSILEAARQVDRSIGQRLRPTLAHAYLLAAVHVWHSPPPRGAGVWRDLPLIGDAAAEALGNDGFIDVDFIETVVGDAMRFDIQLPVFSAASVSARLYGRAACAAIRDRLHGELRFSERRLASGLDPERTSLRLLTLARLLARRRSRHGWRVVWRRLWPHVGTVEAASKDSWSWWRRRIWYQCLHFGWGGLADRIAARRQPRGDSI